MSEKRYVVRLSESERASVIDVMSRERVAARKRRRAQILLKVDEGEYGPGWTDERAAEAFEVHVVSVEKRPRTMWSLQNAGSLNLDASRL